MIDRFLREQVFQRIADAVVDRWHQSCYWLAGHAATAALGASIVMIAMEIMAGLVFLAACDVMTSFGSVGLLAMSRYSEAKWRRDPTTLPNDCVNSFFGGRIFWLVMTVSGLAITILEPTALKIIASAVSLAFLASIYFLACVPRPPRPRRARPSTLAAEPAA